jgi:tellurite resistance protein
MTTDMQTTLFDEAKLKSVITCALLMSSIDGEVHDTEWNVIQTFINRYWKKDYQEFPKFKKIMEQEIETVFKDNQLFQARLDNLIEKLTTNLTSDQKNALLNLVGDVMIADGIMTLEESKLFATFMEKLGIRIV